MLAGYTLIISMLASIGTVYLGTLVAVWRTPPSCLSVELLPLGEGKKHSRLPREHHIASSMGADSSFCFTKMDPSSRHVLVPS